MSFVVAILGGTPVRYQPPWMA